MAREMRMEDKVWFCHASSEKVKIEINFRRKREMEAQQKRDTSVHSQRAVIIKEVSNMAARA